MFSLEMVWTSRSAKECFRRILAEIEARRRPPHWLPDEPFAERDWRRRAELETRQLLEMAVILQRQFQRLRAVHLPGELPSAEVSG